MSEAKGYKAACLFKSLQLHFNPKVDYNAIGYHFKVSLKDDTFLQSKSRWQYARLEKASNPVKLMLTYMLVLIDADLKPMTEKALFNRIKNKVGDFNEDNINAFVESFYSNLKKDLDNLSSTDFTNVEDSSNISNLVEADNKLYPTLYDAYNDGIISYSTLLVIDLYMTPNMNGVVNKERSKDVIRWNDFVEKSDLVKQVLFVALDETRVYESFRSIFKDITS